jgi:hypothetical protein
MVVAALMTASAVAVVVGAGRPALAHNNPPSMAACLGNTIHPNAITHRTISPSAMNDVYPTSYIVEHDTFRIVPTPAAIWYKIDVWGTTKSIGGETPVAPSGWPLPGARRYMLIGRVNQGTIWAQNTGTTFVANQWFPVGVDSGCLLYHGPTNGTRITLSVNDPDLWDNWGSPEIWIRQWW